MRAFLLLLFALCAAANALPMARASLYKSWKSSRAPPTQAKLFPTCVISADGSTLNGLTCTDPWLSTAMCCLDTRTTYTCSNGQSGGWQLVG